MGHKAARNSLVESANAMLGVAPSKKHKGKQLGESSEISDTDTEGLHGAALGSEQIKLASKLAVAKTALKLKLDGFASLRRREEDLMSQAKQLHRAALGAREGEYDEQTRTSAMTNIVKSLSRRVGKHEESMELGETLFAKKEASEEDDLGESSSTN